MNFYNTFKRLIALKSPRMKLMLIAAGRKTGMRYLGVFIDPVMACNIRCRMCYFSDPAKRPAPQGLMSDAQIEALKKSVLPKALKMQIGCGAEPTLYRHLPQLIKAGKECGVPYIEMTTNGQLLTTESLTAAIEAGLNGITLSLHGTTRETFEYLMDGASYDKLLNLLDTLRAIREAHPEFQLRINYTVNNLNKNEITSLWQLFDGIRIDVLQIRPIQKLGDTAYNDFEITDYEDFIDNTVAHMAEESRRRGTITLLPSKENVEKVTHRNSRLDSLIEEATYCYISPKSCYRDDFDPAKETIKAYQYRSGISRRLLRGIFSPSLKKEVDEVSTTKKLNYN